MVSPASSKIKPVTKSKPCQLCDAADGCSRTEDGMLLCRKREGRQAGFICLGKRDQWSMYRREGDPVLEERDRERRDTRKHATKNGDGKPTEPDIAEKANWEQRMRVQERNLDAAQRSKLASTLGLPESALTELRIGYISDPACWTFAEHDGTGNIIGINRRYCSDGRKACIKDSRRGVYVARRWRERDGDVYIPEGASCTLALSAMGLAAIGRPSNTGGVDHLAALFQDVPHDKRLVVLGEHDTKANGEWPGLKCKDVSEQLSKKLGRVVYWALPPDGAKDARAWATTQNLPTSGEAFEEDWHAAGERFVAGLELQEVKPDGDTTEAKQSGLATTCLATIQPMPIHWLVPGVLPLGKLVLLAGDGGHGKSTLTLDMAACLTRGRPCLGREYAPLPRCEVLLISCEDDSADTVVPRLLSAGADLSRIHRVDGITTEDGKPAPFTLAHYVEMEAELTKRPDVRLVVIDPAGAYIGKSGVDDYKDSDLRGLLGPMAELAARRQVTIILVKHLIKGATAKAVHKVGGSTGYVNTVRAAFVVAPDKDDENKKLLLPIKFNLGPRPDGLAYRMAGLTIAEKVNILDVYGKHLDAHDQERLAAQLYHIEWLGTVDDNADDVLSEQPKQTKRADQAADWLKTFLAKYAYPAEEIKKAGNAAGFNRNNLFDGKNKAGISAKKLDFAGGWWWGIGDPLSWNRRPYRDASDTSTERDGS
jgi:hypothetical protein